MPTYRYECGSCAKVHEVFHSINEDPRRECPDCGGELSRLIGGGGGVLLRGEGFYTTDNRSGSYKEGEKKEREASQPSSKDTKKSSDSKGSSSGDASKSKKKK